MKTNVRYYHFFEDQRELFEDVKDGIDHIDKSKLEWQRSNPWGSLLYSVPNMFDDEVQPSLQDKINQINDLLGGELSRLRYYERDGQSLIIFVFDWERVDGDTYDIVYSKSRDALESYYSNRNVQYDLIKLDDDWYGTRIR
ncbi:hypothetical protein [Paraliobacillus salinarum]|uniref:hypothetical protein n=1 Tax=Paraliobacillus salinarum TaxID=1158996 RepID=UPI0015F76EA7|nr:hypothetical protein [Paraliobacillus salinarum]